MVDNIGTVTLQKSRYLTTSLENAKKRADYFDKKLKSLDNKFALFRLITIIAFLAILVSLFSKQDPIINLLLIVLFLVYCLLSSWIHNIIQAKQRKWKAYSLSYSLSQSRITRDFNFISSHKSPWHDETIRVPKGHIYSSDLDIHTHLFLLFNTCSTAEGSSNLFKLFMEAGVLPTEKNLSSTRSLKANFLSHKTQLLRRFEALRLDEQFLQKFFKQKEKKQEEAENVGIEINLSSQGNQEKVNFYSRNIYSIISIIAWILILFPALLKFINTPNAEELLQPLFLYAMFLFLGVFIFNSVTENANKVSQSSKSIEEVIKAISKKNIINHALNFSFLEDQSIKKINTLNFLINLISLRGNPIFWVTLHIFFPFDAVICFILQVKLKSIEKNLSIWEQELFEFDLLASFARFRAENPSSRFLTEKDRALASPNFIECTNLGHPLIAENKRVCNSIYLQKTSPVVLLTGSNMAGKSTFLRTLGTNILLSNMGAPVCAEKFIIMPSRLLCAIRIDDSLSDGTSYFYAEVKRLKYILDSLNSSNLTPGLFLIDEIFRGTNNKERFTGSLHIINALFDKNSFGFISTHDLALARIDEKDERLINMHFRERLEENKLVFDYLIKEGACPTTNALFIMKQEGLPVP